MLPQQYHLAPGITTTRSQCLLLSQPTATPCRRLAPAVGTTAPRQHQDISCSYSSSSNPAAPPLAAGGGVRPTSPDPSSSPAASTPSSTSSSSSSSSSPKPVLEPRIQVSVNTTSSGVSKAVLLRLQQLGQVEVWATSAANHFTAVAGLGLAAQQLQQHPLPAQAPSAAAHDSDGGDGDGGDQQQQQQRRLVEGLAVTAAMSFHDQPVKDDQKRRLNKLELQAAPAQQLDPALLAPGQAGAISTNRTTGVAAILGLMQQQLLVEEEGGGSSRVQPGAVCVVEARGEQAVTRALKAALSLQAAAGQPLLLRPVAGKVVDVVAEKRGQAQLADGLLLLLSWE